ILDKTKWPSDLLTSPVETAMNHSVSCIPETAPINEVVQAFGRSHQVLLPIVDSGDKLMGIVTKTDVYWAMNQGQDFREPIGTFARREIVALRKGQAIGEALGVLFSENVKQAPVLDIQSRPVGIFSFMDVAAARIRFQHPEHDGGNISPIISEAKKET
ncbi:MAG: CBS domain-containing protein, partial [Nitrospirales bacterium]